MKIDNFPTRIESSDILLRTLQKEDINVWYDGLTETLDDLRAFPNSWPMYNGPQSIESYQYLSDQRWPPYLIFDDDVFAGVIEITRVEQSLIEIGFWTCHSQQGQGTMTKALNCFLNWIEVEHPSIAVVIGVESANKPAIRLAAKVGFVWSNSYINPHRNNTVFEIFYYGRMI